MRGFAVWSPVALVAVGGVGIAAAVEFAPAGSPRLVAVFPPWWASERAIVAASEVAPVAGVGGVAFLVGVVAERPGAAAALRRAGALFVADGSAFPACFSPRSRTDR